MDLPEDIEDNLQLLNDQGTNGRQIILASNGGDGENNDEGKTDEQLANSKKIEDLSLTERRQLRNQRFAGAGGAATTIEALEKLEEQKKKKQERAERFGIVTKEMNEKKIKDRQERFGILTKEGMDAKRVER